jgi:hypothetical protein
MQTSYPKVAPVSSLDKKLGVVLRKSVSENQETLNKYEGHPSTNSISLKT